MRLIQNLKKNTWSQSELEANVALWAGVMHKECWSSDDHGPLIILSKHGKHNSLADILYTSHEARGLMSGLLPWLISHMMTAPSNSMVIHTLGYWEHGCLKTLQSTGQDSHKQGEAHLSPCLMQSQNKPTSLHEAPCQEEGSFLLSEGGGHIVCPLLFPEAGNMSTHNALAWRFKLWTNVG